MMMADSKFVTFVYTKFKHFGTTRVNYAKNIRGKYFRLKFVRQWELRNLQEVKGYLCQAKLFVIVRLSSCGKIFKVTLSTFIVVMGWV